MGGKPSIHIETPEFKDEQWQYQPSNILYPEYGIYRTLSHKKTGELIDQYTLNWINEEEYQYYLQSFNWRYNQPNVVNTRFIVQKSQRQYCAQTFSARIYIEHVLSRLSEIKDVPYPDNLFLVMESLEGYRTIYKHSKYFLVEESQICIDAQGNIKVWVNADLSINYPFSEQRAYGQEQMVERLIEIIAENTDRQTEPSQSFLEFYEQKKGHRGKKFEEAKILVLQYARNNNQSIPTRFQSILSIENQEEYTEPEGRDLVSDPSNGALHRSDGQGWNTAGYALSHARASDNPESFQAGFNPQMYHHQHNYPQPIRMSQSNSFPHQQPIYARQQQFNFMPPYQQFQQFQPYQPLPPYQYYPAMPQQMQQPSVVIPTYQRVEIPLRQSNQGVPQPVLIQPPALQTVPPPESQPEQAKAINSPVLIEKQSQNISKINQAKLQDSQQAPLEIQDLDSPVDIRVTFNKNAEVQRIPRPPAQKQKVDYNYYNEQLQETSQEHTHMRESASNKMNSHYRNNSHQEGNSNSMSEADDMVARSLPIKAGHPGQPNQQLSSFGQSDRSAYSQINTLQQWHGNSDGFGLAEQRKVVEPKKKTSSGSRIMKPEAKPVKYYFSLQQQLQIDPDIAADLAKYLS